MQNPFNLIPSIIRLRSPRTRNLPRWLDVCLLGAIIQFVSAYPLVPLFVHSHLQDRNGITVFAASRGKTYSPFLTHPSYSHHHITFSKCTHFRLSLSRLCLSSRQRTGDMRQPRGRNKPSSCRSAQDVDSHKMRCRLSRSLLTR